MRVDASSFGARVLGALARQLPAAGRAEEPITPPAVQLSFGRRLLSAIARTDDVDERNLALARRSSSSDPLIVQEAAAVRRALWRGTADDDAGIGSDATRSEAIGSDDAEGEIAAVRPIAVRDSDVVREAGAVRRAVRRASVATADDKLIRRLYQEHGGALLAYASRLMGDRALGEDVVQEALIRAWRNPHALAQDKGSVRGYLFTVARNIAIDRHRARAAQPEPQVDETVGTTPTGVDQADQVVDSMVVLSALETLSPDHRAVLRELYFNGRSVEETARELGVPPGTVKSRSFYALRRLREAIADPVRPSTAAPEDALGA